GSLADARAAINARPLSATFTAADKALALAQLDRIALNWRSEERRVGKDFALPRGMKVEELIKAVTASDPCTVRQITATDVITCFSFSNNASGSSVTVRPHTSGGRGWSAAVSLASPGSLADARAAINARPLSATFTAADKALALAQLDRIALNW